MCTYGQWTQATAPTKYYRRIGNMFRYQYTIFMGKICQVKTNCQL